MTQLVVIQGFVIPLKVLIDCRSIIVKIRVDFLLMHFSLLIRFKSTIEFFNTFSTSKKVGQMGVAKHIPRVRVIQVNTNCFSRESNTFLVGFCF